MKIIKVQGPYIRLSDNRKFMVLTLENGKKSTTLYSRYLIEQKLNRELNDNEIVDHINGDKYDDRIENLQVITRSENSIKAFKDNPERTRKLFEFHCVFCKKLTIKYYDQVLRKGGDGPFCSKSCQTKHQWKKVKNNRLIKNGSVLKLENRLDLKSNGVSLVGSSPTIPTI